MSRLNVIIKEHHELKQQLDAVVTRVRENEAIYSGFRVVEMAFLTALSIEEMASRPLRYIEDIFGIELATLFIDKTRLDLPRVGEVIGERIFFTSGEPFDLTFLDNRPVCGTSDIMMAPDFKIVYPIGSYLFVPILDNGLVVGSLNLYSADPERLRTDESTVFIQDLSRVIAVTLRKMLDSMMLAEAVKRDRMTGLLNKGMLEVCIQNSIDRFQFVGEPFAFVLFDFDNFKLVNDTMGHIIGDEVLIAGCNAIENVLPDGSELGRYGGDELYALIPSFRPEMSDGFWELVRDAIAKVADKYGFAGRLGISCGMTIVPDDSAGDFAPVELVRIADRRLYASKNAGKGKLTGV